MQGKTIWNNWKEFERFFGGLKFAVILIIIFALCMIAGTLLESYYGTEFANKALYKTFPFMFLQSLIFLCIILAAFVRLPPKKHLYGFYTIHTGLVLIGMGSFITYIAGIDGHVTLAPNSPTREIVLPQDVFIISKPNQGKKITYSLPQSAFTKKINDEYEDIKIKEYLPFANGQMQWVAPFNHYSLEQLPKKQRLSATYLLAGPVASQEVTLSLHPEAQDFGPSTTLGPLSIHFLPQDLGPCFVKINPSQIIIWNAQTSECFTLEEKKISVQQTQNKTRFLAFRDNLAAPDQENSIITFFPDISPWPVDATSSDMRPLSNSPYRLLNKALFTQGPTLFLFGDKAVYLEKSSNTWQLKDLRPGQKVPLPWMGFELEMLKMESDLVPILVPEYVLPIQKNGQLIKGQEQALKIEVAGKEYWVRDQRPVSLSIAGQTVNFELAKQTLTLPYEFSLDHFKMDTDPGTNNPASYESFVNVFTSKGPSVHHIFMNNPLKLDGYTFYQASYFQDDNGQFGSVLSANVDPGRFLKYLGSLVLIFGAIWHYRLRKKS